MDRVRLSFAEACDFPWPGINKTKRCEQERLVGEVPHPHTLPALPLEERAPFYAWLAQFFVCEIDRETWNALQADGIRETLIRLEPRLKLDFENPLTGEPLENLREEFSRLFLLPNGVQLFASSWASEDDANHQTADEIAQLVDQSLLALGRESIHRAPWGRLQRDHVSVILDLVSSAAISHDPRDQALGAHLERELLAPWFATFGQTLASRAQNPVYVALGRLIASFYPA